MVKTRFRPSKAIAGAIAASLLGWGCAQVAGLDGDYDSFPPAGAGQGGRGGGGSGEGGAGQGGAGSSGRAGTAGVGSGGGLLAIAKPGMTCFEEGSSACFDNAHKLILTCKRTPPGTGDLVWSELEYCRGDDLCDSRPRSEVGVRSGTCQPAVPECLGQQPGARLCIGKTHYVCGPDLVSSDVEECGSEDLCGMTLSRNMTKCVVCEGGTYSCDGEVRRQCKADWLGYDYIEDCAQQGLFCNVSTASCSTNRCEPGDYNCKDKELQQCVDPKQGFTYVAICQGANPVCDAVGKQCDVCRKDEARCRTVISGEKNDRELCTDDGQGWRKDPCVAPNPVCWGPDGAAKCVQCTVVEDCPDRTLCNPRDCNTATNECNDNKQTGPLPATEQIANDCRLKACDDGSEVSQPDPSDTPIDADTTDCLVPTCNAAGNIVPVPRPQNSPCGPGNTGICNATGVCGTCSEGTTSCTSESQVSTCDQNGNPGPSV
nr:hypothetical protein [Polyangiaceae bacterium]